MNKLTVFLVGLSASYSTFADDIVFRVGRGNMFSPPPVIVTTNQSRMPGGFWDGKGGGGHSELFVQQIEDVIVITNYMYSCWEGVSRELIDVTKIPTNKLPHTFTFALSHETATVARVNLSLPHEPAFTFVGTTNGAALVCLSNSTCKAIGYFAHQTESKEPFYWIQVNSPTGWKDVNMGWAGTKTHEVSLQPSEAVMLSVGIRTNNPWRVGITYWTEGWTYKVWTKSFDLKATN